MNIDPGYGETPLEPDEADALTPTARAVFGDQPTKIDVFEAEQAIADEVSVAFFEDVADGRIALNDLLTDAFLRDLHSKLFKDLWSWAGQYRTRELSIGIDPAHIAVELRSSFDTIHHRWQSTNDWTPRELGIAVHAETVRIHGFVDRNGRATRLLADLVFFAAQDPETIVESYDWGVDKRQYITLLREYDVNRDPTPLAAFVPVHRLEDG